MDMPYRVVLPCQRPAGMDDKCCLLPHFESRFVLDHPVSNRIPTTVVILHSKDEQGMVVLPYCTHHPVHKGQSMVKKKHTLKEGVRVWVFYHAFDSTVTVMNSPVWRAPFLFEGSCAAACLSDRFALSVSAPPPFPSSMTVLHLSGLLSALGRGHISPPSENVGGQKLMSRGASRKREGTGGVTQHPPAPGTGHFTLASKRYHSRFRYVLLPRLSP